MSTEVGLALTKVSRRSTLVFLPLWAGPGFAQRVQTGPPPRVGLLLAGSAHEHQGLEQELSARLALLGWKPGQNVLIEGAYANGNLERLPALAEELVRKRVDVIVTGGALTTVTAARATQEIPIVFSSVHYPVEQGLVQSYSKPGRNITGPALFHGMELTVKRIDFLRECAPAATRLAWVWPQDLFELPALSGGKVDLRPRIAAAASASGFDVQFHSVAEADDLDAVFSAITASGAHVLSGGIGGRPEPITEFALRRRMPSAYPARYFVQAGGLISYGPVEADVHRGTERTAVYVDRILRGARAADLPVEQPSRFELALNAKTAKAIGVALPRSLVLRADAVIG